MHIHMRVLKYRNNIVKVDILAQYYKDTCFGCNDKLFIIPERFCDATPPTVKEAIKMYKHF